MALAIALVAVVAATVLFHVFSPWWATPLASNWQQMDDTLTITLIITGAFFIVINLLVGYLVWRYRHRSGQRAAYEPENPRLERWLIAGTSVGIIALLAPGLVVYAKYVSAPRDAMQVEVVGQQWQWSYRFPGQGGALGRADASFVTPANPLGIDPGDPRGQDNRIVNGPELHLPLNRPVKVLLRSKDVLHDFYVPPFRARMNLVPGMVTSFWFTPTRVGRFDILCAQLCGIGHYNMRGQVVVEEPAAFEAWLARQPTFAATQHPAPAAPAAGAGASVTDMLAAQGKALALSKGCVGCHSVDGSVGVGPSWKGLYGSVQTFSDGSSARVDDAFLREEILTPQARLVKGFGPVMPTIPLSEDELKALMAYIRANGTTTAAAAPQAGSPATPAR